MPASKAPRYAASGVDIDANERLIPRYQALAAGATRPEVLSGVGPFSGLFDLTGYPNPVLVASTDGVGTKVLIARDAGRLDTVGEDLVNHCVDDILTAGATPLFFLDYLANHALGEDEKTAIVEGVARGCRATGMALLGGETADMPDVYQPGDFDLAGTIVGIVEKGHQIDGHAIAPGDVLLGMGSTGLHTNGYTLAREILRIPADDPEQAAAVLASRPAPLTESLADALLRVHRCYWPLLRPALPHCKGIAHITGGGIPGNLARVLPPKTSAVLRRSAWDAPALFEVIGAMGEVTDAEMFAVFNMGLGLILAVAAEDVETVLRMIPEACPVGEVVAGERAERVAII